MTSPGPTAARLRDASTEMTPFDGLLGCRVADRYDVVAHLATGGMASVYEAIDTHSRAHVALKVLHPHHARRPSTLRRFQLEADMANTLDTRFIVAARDSGHWDGRYYLIMELLKGQDLRQVLQGSGRLSVPQAVDVALDVCRGLAAAHAGGLVHRDIKPSNIFIAESPDGSHHAKLLDFGIAKYATSGDSTDECSLLGTVGYMAPEQVVSSKRVNHCADIYSLGLVLFEALNGTPAYSGDRTEVLYEIVHGRSISVEDFDRDLPICLARTIVRATARDPLARYASVREFAVAIAPFAGHGFLRSESEYSSTQGAPGSRALGKAASAQLANTLADEDNAPSPNTARRWMAPRQLRRSAMLTVGTLVAIIASGATVGPHASSSGHVQTAYALPVSTVAPAEQTTPAEASGSPMRNDNETGSDMHFARRLLMPLRILDDGQSRTTEHRAPGDTLDALVNHLPDGNSGRQLV